MLTQWHPMQELNHEMKRMRREMDRIFNRWGIHLQNWPALAGAYPPMNLWEEGEFLWAEAELPGFKRPDLEINVIGDNRLTLKGKRDLSVPKQAEWHRQERGLGTFERVLLLPISVDPATVEARLENGVLTIKMAMSAAGRPKKVPVRSE